MIIALDIETKRGLRSQPDNFLLGCIVTDKFKSYTFHKPQDMWNFILELGERVNKQNKKLYVYSANHSFDWNLYAPMEHPQLIQVSKHMFLYHLMETDELFKIRQNEMEKQGKGIPKEKRGYITFLDLFSIYNSSIRSETSAGLKRIGELINRPKTETPEYLIKESLSPEETAKLTFTPKQLKEIETYCINDTEIIIHALNKVKQKLKEENIRVNVLYTIHQIAMNRFLRKLREYKSPNLIQNIYTKQYGFPEPQYPCITFSGYSGKYHSRFCRGGINQAYLTGTHSNTYKIDCNGFWQYILNNMVIPDLKTEHRIEEPLQYFKQEEVLTKTGYSYVVIKVPNIDFGVLPVRVKEHGIMNNVYPNNESIIVGHYTNTELLYAIKLGYEVLYIRYSVLFEDSTDTTFKRITQETYNLRKRSNTEFDNWFYKQMGNSFVGKFTQCFPEIDIKNIPIEDIEHWKQLNYYVTSAHDRYYTIEKPMKIRKRPYYAPILYALVTANARIKHHEIITKFGKDKVIYVDTDSLILKNTTKSEIMDKVKISDKLGDWKFENTTFNSKNEPIPEQCTVWKEKYYTFGEQGHMSGIPMNNIKTFMKSTEKTEITRNRLITRNMTDNPTLIGTQKTETIKLIPKDKPYRKVYIDEFIEESDKINNVIDAYIHYPSKVKTVNGTRPQI